MHLVKFPLAEGSKKPNKDFHWREELRPWEPAVGEQHAVRCDGIAVVDCDGPEAVDFYVSSDEFVPTYAVQTGRGCHYYYKLPGDAHDLRKGLLVAEPHIDLQVGPGAYVVGPGSLHPDTGKRYEELTPWPGSINLLPELPKPVVEIARRRGMTSSRTSAGGSTWTGEEWDEVPMGRREQVMMGLAGYMRKQGASEAAIAKLVNAVRAGMMEHTGGDEWTVDDVLRVTHSAMKYEPDPDVRIRLMEELPLMKGSKMVMPPRKTWTWHPYLPNTCTLLAGREKAGKGMLCAWVASAVTKGVDPGTGEKLECGPKPVLWLTGEDHPQLDIWPRLRAAGWDPKHDAEIDFMDPEFTLRLPADFETLQTTIEAGGYGFVVLDPGRSYISDEDHPISYNNEADIRPALQRLAYWSTDRKLPMLFVHHWRKGSAEGGTEDHAAGTAAWRQVLRHGIEVASVGGDDQQKWALWVGLSNTYKRGFVRSYSIEEVPEYDTARFVLGELTGHHELHTWIKDTREATETPVVIDDVPSVEAWVAKEGLKEGARFPGRDTLAEMLDIPRRQAGTVIKALQAEGRILKQGTTYTWLG